MFPRYLMRFTALDDDAAGAGGGVALPVPADVPAHLAAFARTPMVTGGPAAEAAPPAPAESSAPPAEKPDGERPRNADGTFAKQGQQASTDDPGPSAAQPVAEGQSEGEASPEATDPKDGTPDAKPDDKAAPRVLLVNAEGAPVDANGVVVKGIKIAGAEQDVPLADVVRVFQSVKGVQAERVDFEARAQELHASFEAQLTEAQQQATADREEVATIGRELIEALLRGDDAYVQSVLTEYERFNSPEAQLARERADRQAERDAQERQSETAVRVEFGTYAASVVDALLQQYPHVTREEIDGLFVNDTAALCAPGSGVIPPSRFPQAQRYLAEQLPAKVRERHTAIETRLTQAREQEREQLTRREKDLAAERDRARGTAQSALNHLAAAVRPTGGAASGAASNDPPPLSPTATLEERRERAVAVFRR